jgi:hypothetical protein
MGKNKIYDFLPVVCQPLPSVEAVIEKLACVSS